jgi:hypothetical protein
LSHRDILITVSESSWETYARSVSFMRPPSKNV